MTGKHNENATYEIKLAYPRPEGRGFTARNLRSRIFGIKIRHETISALYPMSKYIGFAPNFHNKNTANAILISMLLFTFLIQIIGAEAQISNVTNIIPTKAINPIIETSSNYTSTTTYRLPPKITTNIDCRMACPNNCYNRTQTYSANNEEIALVTARYFLNYSSNRSFSLFATTHPAFERCRYTYNQEKYNPFEIRVESLDKITIYYKNKTSTIRFSNTDLGGSSLDIEETNRSYYAGINKTIRAGLLDNESDVEITLLKIDENEEKYRKNIIRSYLINMTMKKTAIEPASEEPIITVENETVQQEPQLPKKKSGNLFIAAKSTLERPISFIVGAIIIAIIILTSIGLYFGYKKINT